jgi:CheY-like chemotaxis protein
MRQNVSILVVDDEAIIRDFVAEVLEEYLVVHAVNGQDAIDKMPVKGGDEVIRFAKQFDPNIPIIVITGYTSLDTANECVRMGADGFLSKPFTIAQLRDEVSKCLEG